MTLDKAIKILKRTDQFGVTFGEIGGIQEAINTVLDHINRKEKAMKIYIVNKECIAIGDKCTIPLKGFKEEKEAIKYMNLCIEEILRNNEDFRLQVIDDKHKVIYVEDDYWPDGKSVWYIFYISTVEVF